MAMKLVRNYDTVYQLSTYGAVFEKVLDGFETIDSLKSKGDFGIGGVTGLDGEIIILDGEVYHFNEYGRRKEIVDSISSPKMLMSFFRADKIDMIDYEINYQGIKDYLSSTLPTHNIIYAVKVKGKFKSVRTKCYPEQSKPYLSMVELAPLKNILELNNTNGTLVGYVMPEHLGDISGVKYHFHFLSENGTHGGHLLDFSLENAEIVFSCKHKLELRLPTSDDYYRANLSSMAETFNEVIRLTAKD